MSQSTKYRGFELVEKDDGTVKVVDQEGALATFDSFMGISALTRARNLVDTLIADSRDAGDPALSHPDLEPVDAPPVFVKKE